MLYDSASSAPASSSSCLRTRAAFVDVDSPMTRRPVNVVHSRANSPTVWDLPGAGGRDERRGHGVRGQHFHHGRTLFAIQRGALDCCSRIGLADQLRHGGLRVGEDLFLDVQVRQSGPPFLVRRPVDAAAVGLADPERGHVGDVRCGHLDDLGPRPAGDRELDDLGDQRLHVGGIEGMG